MSKHVLTAVCVLLAIPMAFAEEAAKPPQPFADPVVAGPAGRPQVPLAGEWKAQFVLEPGALPGEKWEAKPVQLPKTITMPGGTNNPASYMQGVWFEREAAIPADWQGRQTVLRVGRCLYGVAAYINGKKAGEIPPYGGELDVTALVVPGQSVTLRLYCGRLGKGLETMDRVTRAVAANNEQRDPGGVWLCAPTGVFGLPGEFCLESRSPDLCVQDVWYQTSVRGGTRIEPLVTLWSAAAREGLSCRIRIYEPGVEKPILETTSPLGRLPLGRSDHRLVLPAGTLKLWGVLQPNLYFGQAVVVDAAGKELDRSEAVRFGIREFWAQGRLLFLNDRAVCPVPANCAEPKDLDKLMATGVTMVQDGCPYWLRFSNVDNRVLAGGCDERGVLMAAIGMIHHELNLADPGVFEDYLVWAEHYYRRYRNHPSIVVYGLGINAPGNFNDFSPAKMGRTSNWDWTNPGCTRSYLVGREFDPTRLYYYHGGPRGGDFGSANFYPNHTPIQEVEDWPCEWSEKGDRPFLTFEGLLSTFNVDQEKGGVTYVTEYAARLAGDSAYAAENDTFRTYIAYERSRKGLWDLDMAGYPLVDGHRAETLWRSARAWRYYGIGFENWAGAIGSPGALKGQPLTDRAALELRTPTMAWIGGPAKDFPLKDHNFYAGQTVEKTLLGIYDRQGGTTWEARWELKERGAGAEAASGQLTQKMSPFSRAKVPFSFRLPDVKAPAGFDLTLTVKDKVSGSPVANDSFALTVYPRPASPGFAAAGPAATERSKAAPFLVFDPEGETTAWLASLGVATAPWKAGSASPGSVLVMGRRALRGLKALPFTAKEVETGLRVVVFEQQCAELDRIGFRHEDRSPRQVFVRQADHPLAAGLTVDALRDWQGHATLISEGPMGDRLAVSTRSFRTSNRGSVASDVIETPHCGPFSTLVECEFDLSYTPLMTWRYGKGEMIYCQFDLVGRVGREPGADLVAANLVSYLRKPLEPRVEKTAVCLDEATVKAVEALGFSAAAADRLDAEKQVLVVAGGQESLLAAKRDKVASFLASGGTLVALYADEKLLADPVFGGRLKAEPARVMAGNISLQKHPLLRGVGPQNLHWRATVDLVKVTSADKDFVSLLDGLMGVLPAGKGRIVLFQVEPKRMADLSATRELDPLVKDLDPKTNEPKAKPLPDARLANHRKRTQWQVTRLHSLVLANLVMRSSEALTRRLFEVKPTMPTMPVNEWVVMGPFPPLEAHPPTPLDRKELDEFASHRDIAYEAANAQGGKVKWSTPSDSANGLGLDGKNDLGKIYGVGEGLASIAVTHIWSTRAREATLGIGADWWMRVIVNGERVFNTGGSPYNFAINFDNKVKARLKAGWNEVVVYLAAGANGNIFWFEINNPGDVVVAQQLKAPADAPAGLPPAEDLVPDNIDPGFRLYAEPMTAAMDPYAYCPW